MVKLNLISNIFAGAWTSIISIIFIPFYIRLLGIESYGLIGVYASLVGMIGILDMGLSSTVNKKIASLISFPEKIDEIRVFFKTVEIIFWIIGASLAIIIFILSGSIAENWLSFEKLDSSTVKKSIILIGFIIASEWPLRCYYGGLRGLQKQVRLNFIKIFFVFVQNFGALILLKFYSSSIIIFFSWQVIVSLLHTITSCTVFRMSLPGSHRVAKFNIKVLRKDLSFTKGLFGISLVSLFLSQADKVILSKMLSLEVFAYYMFSVNLAQMIYVIAGPFYTTLFPRFTELVSLGRDDELSSLYHKSTQFLSVLIFPVAIILVFFSQEIVSIWSGDLNLATNTSNLIKLACVGFTFNALMQIPYALQLSYAWTKLTLTVESIALIIFVPLVVLFIASFNAFGALIAKIIIFFLNFILIINFMHKKILVREKNKWLLYGIAVPLIPALLIAIIMKSFQPVIQNSLIDLGYIFFVYFFTITISVLATQYPREYLLSFIKSKKA